MREYFWVGKCVGFSPESLTYFRIEKDVILIRIRNHGLAAVLEKKNDDNGAIPDLPPNVKIYVSKKEMGSLEKNLQRLYKKSRDLLDKDFLNGE